MQDECWIEFNNKHMLVPDSTFFHEGLSIRAIDQSEEFAIVFNGLPLLPGSDQFNLTQDSIKSGVNYGESVFVIKSKDCSIIDVDMVMFSTAKDIRMTGEAELLWPGTIDSEIENASTIEERHKLIERDYNNRLDNSFRVNFRFCSKWLKVES